MSSSITLDLADRLPSLASFDHDSFVQNRSTSSSAVCPLVGELVCTNLEQDFVDFDKRKFLDESGAQIWAAIQDGRAINDPERHLSRCRVLVYADLKRYNFLYWFAYPALSYPASVKRIGNQRKVTEEFDMENLQVLQSEYDTARAHDKFQNAFFIVRYCTSRDENVKSLSVHPLSQYETVSKLRSDEASVVVYFAYSDPSANQEYPGWPLRNYLCLIASALKLDQVNILRIRKNQVSGCRPDLTQGLILTIRFDRQNISELPKVTGWERNESQLMGPKRVNLSGLLDPRMLAKDAVNLNLRLMKWRLLPRLDLDKIAESKCLILGCGTLGCHIARGLLAWGVKDISLVDNAKISYSNPVRQSLYNFEDCVSGGQHAYKAEYAASSLKRIHPTVNVTPYVLSIPMPGHHIDEKELAQTRKDVQLIERLIDENDAIFLLMDTRESRWLPTIVALAKHKLVINAAIGFDTFLLQRYGTRGASQSIGADCKYMQPPKIDANLKSEILSSDELGCYYCSDIVAPGDSTLDRTLDQQCTVSRPGVSMLVSALAVELFASVVSSRYGQYTPAPVVISDDFSSADDENDMCGCELGVIPHTIRGNLNRYHIYKPTCSAFNKCSACSHSVIEAYKEHKFEFLRRVFDDPCHLEDIAGLKELQNVSDDVLTFESDDDCEPIRGFEACD